MHNPYSDILGRIARNAGHNCFLTAIVLKNICYKLQLLWLIRRKYMSSELIRAENIVKNFGLTKALQGVDFALNAGEIRGLIGENGSGKSTIMSIAAGMATSPAKSS